MKIISDFKIKDNNYILRLAKKGDIVVAGMLKYIRTNNGYVRNWEQNLKVLVKL